MSIEAEPNLEDKDYKKTPKLTWIAVTEKAKPTPCVCVFFDHIISKPVLAKDEDFKQYINTNTRVNILIIDFGTQTDRHWFPVCRLRWWCWEIQNLSRYAREISSNFKDAGSSFVILLTNPSGTKIFDAHNSPCGNLIICPLFPINSAHSCREAPIVLFSIPDGSKPAEAAKSTVAATSKKGPVSICIFSLLLCIFFKLRCWP